MGFGSSRRFTHLISPTRAWSGARSTANEPLTLSLRSRSGSSPSSSSIKNVLPLSQVAPCSATSAEYITHREGT